MKQIAQLVAALSLLLITAEAVAEDFRTWKDSTGGYTVRAKFLSLADGAVRLKKESGSVITVPIKRLSAADQEYAKSRTGAAAKPADKPENEPVEAEADELTAFRTWTVPNRGTIKMQFVKLTMGMALMRSSPSSRGHLVPVDRFSEADQTWLKERGVKAPKLSKSLAAVKARNDVATLFALELIEVDSHVGRGIDRLMEDAQEDEALFKHVSLAAKLMNDGKAGAGFQAAMDGYAKAKTDDEKKKAIRGLLTTNAVADIHIAIALGLLKKDEPTVRILRNLVGDAVAGTIEISVANTATKAYRKGFAGEKFKKAVIDYDAAKTDDQKKAAADNIMKSLIAG